MEETPSWKGHSFTLLVFGGIVVLCSIFFVLGMLVGRNQGQRIAETAAADMADRKHAAQPLPDAKPLDYHEETTEDSPDLALEPLPAPPAPAEPPAPEPPPAQAPVAEKFYLQILASKDDKEATRALDRVKSKGFRAMTLGPAAGGQDAYYRVLVGPYDTIPDSDVAKRDLESHGYEGVFRK
jgi:cell division septation protein DedD